MPCKFQGMNRYIFFLFIGFLAILMTQRADLAAQTAKPAIDSSFHTTYYDQKRSLFELLPDGKEEIIFLGNSITDIGEWAEIFQDARVKNRGISGDNTFGVLDRLDEVLSSKPLKIFLMIGINDLAQQIPDEIIIVNYERIIRKIKDRSPSTRLYLESVLPTNDEFTEFPRHQNKDSHIQHLNYALQRLAKESGCTYIDLYQRFKGADGKLDKRYTNDGLHLKGAGYMLWRDVLREKGYM